MAVRDLEAFIRQRAGIFDPGLDVSPGSPFDSNVVQPLLRRLGTDPFSIDLSTFIYERINQAFPDMAVSEGDAVVDLLIKPATLLWDPIVREIQRVRQNQSFGDASQLTTEEAEALGANIFANRDAGQFARGPARIFFAQPQNISVTPVNFVSNSSGLHFFPTETQSIRTEEMLLNISDDGTYYFDINVIAEAAGVEYNIDINSLSSIANLASAVRVTNLRRFSFGQDDETASDFISRIEGELTERSLVTLRGISAKITNSFPDVTRLNVVGFNDPEMNRDVLKGGGLGDLLAAGSTGFVDDDGEGQAHSRRFGIQLTEGDFAVLTTVGDVSSYVVTVFGVFDDGSFAKDLHIETVIPNNGTTSSVDFVEQSMKLSTSTSVIWILRRRTLTLSSIPGGIIFPQGPLGTVTVKDDEVHIGGATDVHVGGSAFDQSTLVLDSLADNEPEAQGSDAVVIAGTFIQLNDHVLGTDYLVTDPLFQLFKNAGRNGMTVQLLDNVNGGAYRVVSVTQTTGSPAVLLTDPRPATVSAAEVRWKLLGDINVELTDPRETIVTGVDLTTVQGSAIVGTASSTDFNALSVLDNFVLRILDGVDAGDVVITGLPTPTTLQLAKPLGSTGANIRYEVFRPNVAGAATMPLIRIDKIDVLDSSSQPIGTTIPYARPIDIQSRAFQNPARGIKLDVRDARLGIVSLPAGTEATGTITTVGPPQINDGETFVLNDGINAPLTFEFDKNGTFTPGHVQIDISALLTAQQVRDATITAINSIGSSLRITASASATTNIVDLINVVPGAAGNQTITDTVANPAFTTTGMSGGANTVYGITAGDTLNIDFMGFEGLPATTVNVVFSSGPLALGAVITAISTAIASALLIPSGAIQVGVDRFGIRPLRAGARVTGGTALGKLFGPAEVHTSWDVRSDTVDELGGWAALNPALDLESGLDVVQVLDGQQVGFYGGPYFLPTPTGLEILDLAAPIPVVSNRFAPEANVHVQVGSRSLGSVRCFFLDPTSIEFDQNTRFSVDTPDGTLRYLPDPSLTTIRVPPPPATAKPTDGSSSGGGTIFTSLTQDFVRAGIQRGDLLNIDFIPLGGTVVLSGGSGYIAVAGLTFVYSLDSQTDRVLTFIRDDLSIPTGNVTFQGIVDQINASVGKSIASLDGSSRLLFTSDVSFVVRKVGTANTLILNQVLGLPTVPRYDYSQVDQANDSPHKGQFKVASVTATVLTLETLLPSSGDYTDPVTNESFTVEREGVQRIATTQMALNTVDPSLYYFDVELVSEGSGDHYNIDSALQLTVSNFRSDGYYLTTDNVNLTFSPAEKPRLVISPTILENGVSDSPTNATQLTGTNIQLTYDRSQLVEDVNNFMGSEIERVINESPLGRHLIPHFVRFALRYVGGSTEDLVTQDIETYLQNLSPSQAIESSDLQKIVSNRGALSIQNPIDLLAVVHYTDRTIYAARSQNALTTGRLAAFIPDILDIKRNTA